jgi:hypothetical protein
MPEKPKIQIKQTPEWYVMGTDGVTYGPFEISQISDYIKQGRITADTRVQHPKHTGGVWEFASKVSFLSQFFRAPSPPQQQIDLSQVQSRVASKSDTSGKFMDLFDLSFKRFATPWVVRILWVLFLVLWLVIDVLLLLTVFSSFLVSIKEAFSGDPDRLVAMIPSLMILAPVFLIYKVGSLLLFRLACEGLIIIFDIRNQLILLRESR